MARRADESKIRKVMELLKTHPGRSSGEYARMMDCHREAFIRVLTQLEDRGVLLAEDRDGRLWLLGTAS